MAYEGNLKCIPGIVAAADLSAKQFTFVKIDSNGQAAANTAEGAMVDGVLQNKPAAQGEAAAVAYAGVTKVVAGDTVAAGGKVISDTAGKAIPAATGKFIRGTALTGGAADEVISILLAPTGYSL
ncbi:MAG: DUF2190 family protein [Nitrospinaceae bacterium]|nr:DUF2190 family protein [Deltaproteobacteria bacterium]NIY14233.1 DUF2190 family protein [Nitrospinaceae bacterium]